MSENIIEILNTDVIVEIDNTSYDLFAENITVPDYNYWLNKPSINSVRLVGDKTSADLGLVSVAEMSLKEDVLNKVVSISDDVTDCQYPSAKCIKDELLCKADVNLSNLSLIGQMVIDEKADISLSNLSLIGQGIIDGKANTDLSNLSFDGQAVIDGKADVDLSNISNINQNAKTILIRLEAPDVSNMIIYNDNNYTTTMTAPSDGYVIFHSYSYGYDAVNFTVNGVNVFPYSTHTSTAPGTFGLLFPVQKNDICSCTSSDQDLAEIRFFPKKGSE